MTTQPNQDALTVIAEVKRALAGATPGPYEIYTSNSHRRVGLANTYQEVCWATSQPDGHGDFAGLDALNAMVAAFNSVPRLIVEIERLDADCALLTCERDHYKLAADTAKVTVPELQADRDRIQRLLDDANARMTDLQQLTTRQTNQLRRARSDMECNDPGNARVIFGESQS